MPNQPSPGPSAIRRERENIRRLRHLSSGLYKTRAPWCLSAESSVGWAQHNQSPSLHDTSIMNANTFLAISVVMLLSVSGTHAQRRDKAVPPGLEERVKEFFAEKEAQAHTLARQEDQLQAPEIWDFFE